MVDVPGVWIGVIKRETEKEMDIPLHLPVRNLLGRSSQPNTLI